MLPALLGVRLHPLVMAAAIALGVGASFVGARRAGIPARRWVALQAVLLAAAVVGAKAYAVVEQGRLGALPGSALT